MPNADALFLVLEYLPGGCIMEIKMGQSAEDAQPPFGLDRTWEYFRQLCLGLEYLHANEVVHRDVSPLGISRRIMLMFCGNLRSSQKTSCYRVIARS